MSRVLTFRGLDVFTGHSLDPENSLVAVGAALCTQPPLQSPGWPDAELGAAPAQAGHLLLLLQSEMLPLVPFPLKLGPVFVHLLSVLLLVGCFSAARSGGLAAVI